MDDAFVHFVFVALAAVLVAIETKHKLLPRPPQNPEFRAFQIKYLRVYYAALFADWLQGPYLYRLYEQYGYLQQQIAALYAIGYVAAMVSGPLLGGMADKYGRKKMCLIFCGTYALSCMCKLSPAFFLLMLGRVLGGVSTSLLLSTFEAWMVSEHNRLGFPSDWLPKTFALATFGNGVLAVAAGIIANLLADPVGSDTHHPVRPFVLAIGVLMATAFLLNKSWEESKAPEDLLAAQRSGAESCVSGLKPIIKQRKVWLLAVTQAFFEAAMFTFVFLWTPTLSEHKYHSPLGFIFATFMLAIVLGSTAFQLALELKWSVARCLDAAIALSIVCFTASFIFNNHSAHFVAFVGFEVACGVYFPAIGSLRGELIPEADRAATMGWIRVPINILTIILMFATRTMSHHALFGVCAGMCCAALVAHRQLMALLASNDDEAAVPTGIIPVKSVSQNDDA